MRKARIIMIMLGTFFAWSIAGINSASALSLSDIGPVSPGGPPVDFSLTLASDSSLQMTVETTVEAFLKTPTVDSYLKALAAQAGVVAPSVVALAKAMAGALRSSAENWEKTNTALSRALLNGDVQGLLDIARTLIEKQAGDKKKIDITRLPALPRLTAQELKGACIAGANAVPLSYLRAQIQNFIVAQHMLRPAADAPAAIWDKEFRTFLEKIGFAEKDVEPDTDVVKTIAAKVVEAKTKKTDLAEAETVIKGMTGRMKSFLEAAL